MKKFMDEDFLLDTEAARKLFHDYAENCPIIDYHNHLSTKDMAARRTFDNLTQIWLEGDHYKWRAMRGCGVDESLITGKESSDYEKFLAWAKTVSRIPGCPVYHWTHLELQRYFGIHEPLTPDTAPAIWEKTCAMLKEPGFDAISLLEKQNVKVLCTTDDPADSLEWHFKLAQGGITEMKVLPSFRPDRFIALEAPAFRKALSDLEARNGGSIGSLEDLKASLGKSLDRFGDAGCRVSDHGFSVFTYGRGDGADAAFKKALAGETLTAKEIDDYRGEILRFLGGEYARRGIAMQLHIGPLRNVNSQLYDTIGADAGGDSVGGLTDIALVGNFLDDLVKAGTLPNTVLYNANPADNMDYSTLAIDFAPKVKFGAAWWFIDNIRGMKAQTYELMETGALAESVGMLTDSRSFTSFPRHEYFRRILCATLGELIETGQYPDDIPTLGKLVEDVCWKNAVKFFRLG